MAENLDEYEVMTHIYIPIPGSMDRLEVVCIQDSGRIKFTYDSTKMSDSQLLSGINQKITDTKEVLNRLKHFRDLTKHSIKRRSESC